VIRRWDGTTGCKPIGLEPTDHLILACATVETYLCTDQVRVINKKQKLNHAVSPQKITESHSLQLHEPWGVASFSMFMQAPLVREHLLAENAAPGSGIHPGFVKLGMRFPVCKELELNPAVDRRILTLFVYLLQQLVLAFH
jgi:hypothetical protein